MFTWIDFRSKTALRPLGYGFQGFTENVLRIYLRSKKERGNTARLSPLTSDGAVTSHGGGSAHAKQIVRTDAITQTPDEHGDVGCLAPAVGVDLINDEALQGMAA